MERMKIAALFADQEQLDGKEVTVCGWARTIRDIMRVFCLIVLFILTIEKSFLI